MTATQFCTGLPARFRSSIAWAVAPAVVPGPRCEPCWSALDSYGAFSVAVLRWKRMHRTLRCRSVPPPRRPERYEVPGPAMAGRTCWTWFVGDVMLTSFPSCCVRLERHARRLRLVWLRSRAQGILGSLQTSGSAAYPRYSSDRMTLCPPAGLLYKRYVREVCKSMVWPREDYAVWCPCIACMDVPTLMQDGSPGAPSPFTVGKKRLNRTFYAARAQVWFRLLYMWCMFVCQPNRMES